MAFGLVRQALCLRFLMVAVAHQVEHRIVAPEVAGSRPVSHPTYSLASDLLFSLALLFSGALGSFMRHRAMPYGATLAGYRLVGAVRLGPEERKKEGAIHAPVRCVSGLGLMAFRGHLKHPCRPDMHA